MLRPAYFTGRLIVSTRFSPHLTTYARSCFTYPSQRYCGLWQSDDTTIGALYFAQHYLKPCERIPFALNSTATPHSAATRIISANDFFTFFVISGLR